MAVPRPRPTPQLLDRLRAGKRVLHAAQREMPTPDKIKQLLALQKIDYEIRSARGELKPWEIPWDIEP